MEQQSSQVPHSIPSSSTAPKPEKSYPVGLNGKNNEWFANLAASTIDRIRRGESQFYEVKKLVDFLRAKEDVYPSFTRKGTANPEYEAEKRHAKSVTSSISSNNEQLKWLIQNVRVMMEVTENDAKDERKQVMAKESGYPPNIRDAVASIQAHARKTIAETLFSKHGGHCPSERLKNFVDSWIQLAYPEPGKGLFPEFGFEVTIELKPLVLRDAVEEQERTGIPMPRDSLGLPRNLKVRDYYDQFPGTTFARPRSQNSATPPVVVPSEHLIPPGVPGDPSDDDGTNGSDSWSTDEDIPSDEIFFEDSPKDKKEKKEKREKKDKKETKAPRTLAEWFHFEDEEPKEKPAPEQSTAKKGKNVETKTSKDKVYTWDKALDGPIVVKGFSPVSPSRAPAILKEVDEAAASWRLDSIAGWGEDAANSPKSSNEVAEGPENDSSDSFTDSDGETRSDGGRSLESPGNEPGRTISTEVTQPTGDGEEASTTRRV
ncbi:MAG: hypothetical protein Q9167_007510 [Letrouitia subvulpina]